MGFMCCSFPSSEIVLLSDAAEEFDHPLSLEDGADRWSLHPVQVERRATPRAHRVDRRDRVRAAEAVDELPQLGVLRGLPRLPAVGGAGRVWAEVLFPVHCSFSLNQIELNR